MLKARNNDLNQKGTGSTFKAIGKNVLEEVAVPQISRGEQQKCMDMMDLLESIIRERKSQLDKLDELIKARFVELFGDVATEDYKYETKKLGDVAEVGSSHRVFTSEFVKKGIPFYRGTEIGELANGQKPSDPYYISEEHYSRLANDETKPKVGDLLMPSICNKGQVWMVDTEEPFYYKDGRVLCISPDREIYNPKYLQYFMRVKTEVEYPKMGSGSTFAEFKIFLLKDFDILTPPRTIQDGEEIRRKRNKSENRISNQTLPRLAFQIFESQLNSLSTADKESFPICRYTPNNEMICGIYPTEAEFKKHRNTMELSIYKRENGPQFVIYSWNVFSTLYFVQECLKRFGNPGDKFVRFRRPSVNDAEQ